MGGKGLCAGPNAAAHREGRPRRRRTHLQLALPLQEAVVQQVPVPHGARHLLQERRSSVLAEDAAQQICLQRQNGQLLLQAGALGQGRLQGQAVSATGRAGSAAGTRARSAPVCCDCPGSEAVATPKKQAGRNERGRPEFQGQRDPSHPFLLPKLSTLISRCSASV